VRCRSAGIAPLLSAAARAVHPASKILVHGMVSYTTRHVYTTQCRDAWAPQSGPHASHTQTQMHGVPCAAMMIHPYKPRDYFSSSSVQARLSILSLILSIIVMLDRQTFEVEPFNTPLPFSLVRLKPRESSREAVMGDEADPEIVFSLKKKKARRACRAHVHHPSPVLHSPQQCAAWDAPAKRRSSSPCLLPSPLLAS